MVPALYPHGSICVPCLAQRRKRIPGQGRSHHFPNPTYTQHAVVLRFLRVEVTAMGPCGNSPLVDGNPVNYDQLLPRFKNSIIPSLTLYTVGQLCHYAEFLYLPAESVNTRRSAESLPGLRTDCLPFI